MADVIITEKDRRDAAIVTDQDGSSLFVRNWIRDIWGDEVLLAGSTTAEVAYALALMRKREQERDHGV